jgi:transposase
MAPPKKGAVRQRQLPVFIDEAGAYLLPATVRTYAPCGLTPELEVYATYDHVSIMGALTPAGDLYTALRPRSLNGQDSARFLVSLQERLGRRLLVLWDGATIHRSQEVRQFLAQGGSRLVQLEPLPSYSPELNPQEGVWHLLKNVELGNVCCLDLPELSYELRLAIARLRRQPDRLLSCFEQAGLKL